MDIPVVVPNLGNEVSEAQIDEWLVAVGDMVNEGDQLVLITTPKVAMELEAPASGIISAIQVPADELVSEGTTLALITAADA